MITKDEKLKELLRISCERWEKTQPNPKCELVYKTPYQLLVSVVLSAQTTDKMVNRVMEPLYEKDFSAKTVLSLGQEAFYKLIKSIGLAPTKSKNILKLSEILLEKYEGEIPNKREELEELPGVGRKTANVVLGEIFKKPTLAVDTHVLRVSKRLGLHTEKDALKAEKKLLSLIDQKLLPKAHHWFILHGRYTCKAKNPDCKNCILEDLCPKLL